ncbi:MAG: hypothetical protein V4642_11905 [Bacteroidota bacterium]
MQNNQLLKSFVKTFLFISIFFLKTEISQAQYVEFDELQESEVTEYILRLTNGDILTGKIVEITDDEGEPFLKLKSAIGTATIYQNQIVEIRLKEEYYRHNHRIFIMPTAEPIGDNHFVGLFELLFAYAGVGIYDVGSITVGRTLVPGIPASDQLTIYNAKATVYTIPDKDTKGGLHFAIGANVATIGKETLSNIYGVATLVGERSRLTGMLFFKSSGSDVFDINLGRYGMATAQYATGSVGIGIGADAKFSTRYDTHVIAELWNNDVARPTNTAVLLGLRQANSDISMDFGLAFFTQPAVAPFVSFTWTPFFNSNLR